MNVKRKMKRQAAKLAYKRYCKHFSSIKRMQLGMTRLEMKKAEQIPLGRRFTFKQWYEAVRKPAAFKSTPEEVQEHVESLEWDE